MPSQTWNRIDLAVAQLDTALMLFLDRQDYPAVITLAGAADVVLAEAVRRNGGQPILEWEFQQTAPVHALMYRRPLPKEEFFKDKNRVRNALKHFDKDNATADFTADLEEAACWMLVRACENASRLGREMDRFTAFEEWFYEHVVGAA